MVILYLKKTKKANFIFFLMKGKKRKDLIVNYRTFAIPTPQFPKALQILITLLEPKL
jgi:hypothetical protein